MPGKPGRPSRGGRGSSTSSVDKIAGDRVAQLRMRHGWSHRDLVARLKRQGSTLSRSSLAEIEAGFRKVRVGELLALALVLEVSPLELLMPTAPTDLIAIGDNVAPEMAIKVRLWILGHGALIPHPVTGERRDADERAQDRRSAERFYEDHGRAELDRRRFVQQVQQATRELTEASIVDDRTAMTAALDQLERLASIGRDELDHEQRMASSYEELERRREITGRVGREPPSLEEEAMSIVESWARDDLEDLGPGDRS